MKNPITGNLLPIVLDPELVDPKFGTGVVKITPSHDFNDYLCGKRHNLSKINVFDSRGLVLGEFSSIGLTGLDRFHVRQLLRRKLNDAGMMRGEPQNHSMRIAICSRSGDIVEPMIQPQWYLKCSEMANNILQATHSGELQIRPASVFQNLWLRWLGKLICI